MRATSWEATGPGLRNLFPLKETDFEREENRYPNYCLSWSKHIRNDKTTGKKFHVFSCCGGDTAVIVGVEKKNPSNCRKLLTFIDEDPDERFRACAFGGKSSSGREFLILGGKAAVIKLVDMDQKDASYQRSLVYCLQGHDSLINDLKVSPARDCFLLSASTDESIRLWNLNVRACVAVFAGRYGHRRAVHNISWDIDGTRFASSGVDGYIRLWDVMGDEEVREAIHARMPVNGESIVRGRPYYSELPYFSSRKLHSAAADCVHWLSEELLLSKSVDNEILLWTPDFSKSNEQRQKIKVMAYPPAKDVTVFMKFQLSGLRSYFSRFDVDSLGSQLAVGEVGSILVWNLDEDFEEASQQDDLDDDSWLELRPEPKQTLETSEVEAIRVAAFAPFAELLVACSDNGTINVWGPVAEAASDSSMYDPDNDPDDESSDEGSMV